MRAGSAEREAHIRQRDAITRDIFRGHTADAALAFAIIAFTFGTIAASFAAWGTSIVSSCLHSQWALLIVDLFVFPAGVVHGVGIWFGVW